MLSYPVRLIREEGGRVLLVFPDIPEAQVFSECEEDALTHAREALETTLSGYVCQGRPIPTPSDPNGSPSVSTSRFSLAGMD